MKQARLPQATVPPVFFAKLLLPFAAPIIITMAMVLLAGDRWPRNIAPGSGLKLAGLIATVLTCIFVWRFAVAGIADRRVHKFAAILCAVTGLLGWPVWTMGLLPSVNGFKLDDERTVTMTLERTEMTRQSKSNIRNHWVWLRGDQTTVASSGRYISPRAFTPTGARGRPVQCGSGWRAGCWARRS